MQLEIVSQSNLRPGMDSHGIDVSFGGGMSHSRKKNYMMVANHE